jgi:hypothetical protein
VRRGRSLAFLGSVRLGRIVRGCSHHVSYANVTATLALFVALGGTSYAVLHVGSRDVVDNSLRSRDVRNDALRSRDIHNRTIRARDVRRDSLGSRVVKESALGLVPSAANSERLGGATAQDLRLRCPTDTVPRAGVCIEVSARAPDGFLGAINHCDQVGRGLATMPQLDAFLRSSGPLAHPEWTASVYRNTSNGSDPFDQLETVLLNSTGQVSYSRVYLAVQHAFRCVALPSN